MDQSPPQTSPDQHRLGLVIGVVVFAGVIGLGAWALAPRAASAPGPSGPRLSIALVAPVEPAPIDGGVLDVGMLNDGFDRAALERSSALALTDTVPLDAYAGEDPPPPNLMPEPRPLIRQTSSSGASIITSTDPLADGSHLFGFDRRAAEPAAPPSVPAEEAARHDARLSNPDAFFQ